MRTRWLLLSLLLALCCQGCLSFHSGPLPGEPTDQTWKQIGDTRVRYLDQGEGPAVVLIHGFASSLDVWRGLVPELAKGHRVIALDLRGFGWTDRPQSGDYSPQGQARLVIELLAGLGIDDYAVVAHSWGSSVALEVALAAPHRVRQIALYDAWVYEEQLPTFFVWARAPGVGESLMTLFYKERTDEKMARAFYDSERFVTQERLALVDGELDRPGALAAQLEAIRTQRYGDIQARYREIQQPTLLLWGREDHITLLSYGERLVRDLPDARLVVYPRCGHFPMYEAARPSTQELLRFLAAAPQQAKEESP